MDISIENLKKYIFDLKTESIRVKRAQEILSQPITVTEKVDGTKLTLVRTNERSNDYTKNWLVSYKGELLYSKEFSHISDKEKLNITQSSIGRAQYVLVFDHLKRINNKIGAIPESTEFSVEFAQNKDTLTRTYVNRGGMFLRSYAKVNYRIVSGKLYTEVLREEIMDYNLVKDMADLLEISPFPIFFKGLITKENITNNPYLGPKMKSTDWNNPVNILEKFRDAILDVPSTLGGKTEGVVIKLEDGRFFKLVQDDQYSTTQGARAEKQAALRLDPEAKTPYFQVIRALILKIINSVGHEGKTEEDVISDVNFYIAKNENSLKKVFDELKKISGGKRDAIGIRDDIHDTIRTMLSNEALLTKNKNTVALIPMGAKPFHKGHFELIELASKECDSVIVFGSLADRKVEGEFPIDGKSYLKFWHDMFIPILPKNVKFKFSESPISSVYMQLRWFEQSYVQDEIAPPTIRIYSDPEDLKLNWKDEVFLDPRKAGCPTLFKAGKIERNEVSRGSKTTDISGTKMRKFLETGDKDSFLKNLPPITDKQKEEIWTTLIQKRKEMEKSAPKKIKEENPYHSFVNEIINKVYDDMFLEGGWRNPDTQEWEVTPQIVSKIVGSMDDFLYEFNAWSGLPELKTKGPTGSGKYYKDDLNDPNVRYGDVDMQMVLPVETNTRTDQLESNKLYSEKIRDFIKTKSPSYIHAALNDPQFGLGYLIFNIDGKKIQVDLVLSYTVSAEWTSMRTTPEKGLKGFVTGMVLSALSDALNVVIGSSTNPYFNTLDGKVVSALTKKGAIQQFLNPSEVFSDIVRFYGKMAGISDANLSSLSGYQGLDPKDPSLKKKLETVVALAKSLEQNGIFEAGVITSKDGTTFTSRKQFIDYVLNTYIEMMERAKTAKKLEKAQTQSAMTTIEKIKKDADIGIQLAKQIIREHYTLLTESGKSVASVDPKTPKTVNGQPAQATTKLKIVDASGKDIHSSVSNDVKDMVYQLNARVRFWKKNNPYIENGFIFNGSSQFLMDPQKFGVLSKYKDSFGDIDIIIPKEKLDALESYLDGIDDNTVEWSPTSKNKLTNSFYYVGRTKSYASIPDQLVTLWYYMPTKQVVQIDFEGDDMVMDPQGYEKPSEWTKFSKDSPWEDLTSGIKGLAGALMLRSLARATTVLPNAVVLTPGAVKKVQSGAVTELTDKEVTKAAQHTVPSAYTLNTGGGGTGIRRAYELVKTMPYNGKMVNAYRFVEAKETKPEDRITDVSKIFEILFKKTPSPEEKAMFRSYQGQLRLMKKYLDKKTINLAMNRFTDILAGEGLNPTEYASIQKATKDILGISI